MPPQLRPRRTESGATAKANAREGKSAKSSPDPAEQRSAIRYTCCTDMHVVYADLPRPMALRMPDISPDGMFINTPHVFALGSALKVRFRLGHTGKLVHARAEVRYCLPGVGIGVEFVDIRSEDRAAIAEETCRCGPEW